MNTEDLTETPHIDPKDTQIDVDSTLIKPITNTYEQIQALSNEISSQSKITANQTKELLTQAQSLYNEALVLVSKYKSPKSDIPQE